MFEDIVVATLFRDFHREVDDELLDRAALTAGCASGIGRMSLLDDRMMARLVAPLELRPQTQLLDLGCGRGFLARWLRWNGTPVRFIGIDRAPEAIAAADRLVPEGEFVEGDYRTYRFEEPFDVVTSLEVAVSRAMDKPLIHAIHSRLRAGGAFAFTAASTDGKHDERVTALHELLSQRFSKVELRDAGAEAAGFTKRLYGAMSNIEAWSPLLAPRIRAQAGEVLAAVDRGDFAYTMAWGRL